MLAKAIGRFRFHLQSFISTFKFDATSPADSFSLEMAKIIATHAVKLYGEGGEVERHRINEGGIWSDHPAVMAAYMALKFASQELREGNDETQ